MTFESGNTEFSTDIFNSFVYMHGYMILYSSFVYFIRTDAIFNLFYHILCRHPENLAKV